ncbi:Dodecin [uncultured archaeon]|nr:Dodecin [uncultured archaeon]
MEKAISGRIYDIVEIVGASTKGWEEAVKNAVDTASRELTNVRIAEVAKLDTLLVEGEIMEYRARVKLSFKHEIEPETL